VHSPVGNVFPFKWTATLVVIRFIGLVTDALGTHDINYHSEVEE